ncbi:MAG: hypothetical protein R3Y13_05570 [bacterium]
MTENELKFLSYALQNYETLNDDLKLLTKNLMLKLMDEVKKENDELDNKRRY